MSDELRIHPVSIDVSRLIERTVATLYSHLVTRPTGRAVRLAIESQLGEAEKTTLSVVDFSEVNVLDFSCADEVVAKLLIRFMADDRPAEAFFLFRGVKEAHRDPIEAVLERHGLAAVAARISADDFALLGERTEAELEVWQRVEERGRVAAAEVLEWVEDPDLDDALDRLVDRKLVFRAGPGTDVHALSHLVRELAG